MNNRGLLLGAAVGAGLIYMLDPQNGRRRRALVRDKLVRASHVTRDAVDATSRDLSNRTRGVIAATRGRFAPDDVSDAVLLERVRARLGRVCSHPRAIDVIVNAGHVTLRGPVLAHEALPIIGKIETVRGVRSVTNELDLHLSAEHVPALQGEGKIAGPRLNLLQSRWAPATRAAVTCAGLTVTSLLAAAGLARRARTA